MCYLGVLTFGVLIATSNRDFLNYVVLVLVFSEDQ